MISRRKQNSHIRSIQNQALGVRLYRDRYLYLLFLPGFVYFIVFHYLPMFGIIIAFQNYDIWDGILGSKWVGFKHFIVFFRSPYAWRIIRNTLLLNVYGLLFAFPIPVVFALFLNEIGNIAFKRAVQTVSYLPHFVSTVVIVGMMIQFLSPSTGRIALFISRITGREPLFYMAKPEWFRSLYIVSGIWQQMGWSAIIYIAALTNVNPELYESAVIDGANRLQRIYHVSLPCIMPTIIILFILAVSRIMTIGFEKAFLMQNSINLRTSEVIATYVYKRGLLGEGGPPDFSYAAAVGLFRSAIGLIMIVTANRISRKVSNVSLW